MKKALTVGLHIRHKARLHGRLTDVEFASASKQEEALEILQGDDFQLLVVDEKLSDSEIFLQKVKALDIPTIYCADGEKSTGFLRSLVVDLGVAAVLTKPVDPDELVRKAGELLSAERTVEEKGSSIQQQMRARLAAMWEKFGPTNRERLDWLKGQVNDLLEGEDKNEAARREMEREAHKMVGALGTFGFPQASILAREIEHHVSPTKTMAHLDGSQLMQWVQAIEKTLNDGPQGMPQQAPETDGRGVLVVSENGDLVDQIKGLSIGDKPLQVESTATWARARESWFLSAPDLVVLDLCGETAAERQTLLNSVAAKLSTIPVLVLLPKDVWNQPDALSRFAGFPILFHPYEPELLNSTVLKLISENTRPKPKVLAVDDDPQILQLLTTLLAPLKLDITTLSDPLEFWDTLERTAPDLLILDLDMPYLSGLEICRGVRSSPRWWELPVLFLSASSDEENLHRLYTVGADDFVPKPFSGAELATRVVNRLVRSSGQSEDKGRADFKNGLDGLRTVLAEKKWRDEQILVALVKVWNDEELVQKLGAAATSQLNRQLGVRIADRLRGMGAVARWRQHEFVICLPSQTLDSGTHLLSTLLSQSEVTDFPVGQDQMVKFQAVAGTTLMKNASESLEAALRSCQRSLADIDGSQTLVHSSEMQEVDTQSGAAEKHQLLILEPDAATGQAVENLFKERGYQPKWVADTEAAVSQLTAEPPTLEAKAVFISSGGLQLLSKLGPVTKLVKVVVAVSTEQELITAFDGGAFDCIEKPCTVGTLIKRLERAVSD